MDRTEQIFSLAGQAESFYLYDETTIKNQIGRLQAAFPGIEFLYSVKCNPNRRILKTVFGCGLGADAASLNEVMLALSEGLDRGSIYYSAPGKTEQDIRRAIGHAILIADSEAELSRISRASEGAETEIGLRINPNFTFESDSGAVSKFGIDEDAAMALLRSGLPAGLHVTGIHVHVKSQVLDAEMLKRYYAGVINLAGRVEAALGYSLSYVNMGSGIGIPYAASDTELNPEQLGRETAGLFADYRRTHPQTRLLIETGRYAVCAAGTYVTHVADRKVSHGKTCLILRNTLNGFLRPSLAPLIAGYAGCEKPPAAEPLFTCPDAFSIQAPYPERETEAVTVWGNLCTSADLIAENLCLPRLEPGDIVTVSNAGAYARVLSPMQFSSLTPPEEYMLLEDGTIAE